MKGYSALAKVITPTEVMAVTSRWGLKFLKFAPAGNFGGAETIKSYASFFPDVKWMPTGGVTEVNVGNYLKMPNVVASGGTSLQLIRVLGRVDG